VRRRRLRLLTAGVATRSQRIPFLIVGAGLAGAKAAEALRQEGAAGPIVLVGSEPDRPYNRPPLSKEFLRGESPRKDVFVYSAGWAKHHGVDLRLGTTAERLDVAGRTVALAGGEVLGFDRLLLATGSTPRPLPIPGAELEGVFMLRTLRDAERLRRAADRKGSALVVGGGFIGAEVAASLRLRGLETTLVVRDGLLWERLFGPELAGVFQRTLECNGVEVVNRDEAVRVEGDGRVERVVTKNGRTFGCDLVVAGVGVEPNTQLAAGTPLEVDDGIVTDEHLRTGHPGIYAAGDVARFYSPLYERRLRVEHWDVAQQHGALAGTNIAHEAAGGKARLESFDQPPYFFSDLFDLSMEYLGDNKGADDVVARGDPAGREFTGFYVKARRLVAALFVNRHDDVGPARALIQGRLRVDARVRGRLADVATDLGSLTAEAVG
jgi:3-phenylpropionate/trans-cinnamate dioxygenase ferredoxin reductase subunit